MTEADAASLTLEEAALLTGGHDMWHTEGVARIGFDPLHLSDGPSGVRGPHFTGPTSTSFPCGTALAATWNPTLVEQVGRALGDEARAKGARVLLGPTVNIHRHPLAGRSFECYSEDPGLTAALAVAYITGVQSRGVACAVKHFVCNDQEHERMTISVDVDERALREIYLPPFEAAVRQAGVWSVMAAYNRLDGTYCSAHRRLLTDILRDEWGFDGLVMSDWLGTHEPSAVEAGLDLEMPGPPQHLGPGLVARAGDGTIEEAAVRRAADRLQVLARRTVPQGPERVEDATAVARQAAREAIVLLANDGVLPLAAGGGSIAVIGPRAHRVNGQGGGSAHVNPPYVVSPLDGIRARAAGAGADVVFEPGVAPHAFAPLGRDELHSDGAPGLTLEYFGSHDLTGAPAHRDRAIDTNLRWLGDPADGVRSEAYGVRGTASFTPTVSGPWELRLASTGRGRLLLDGEVVIDDDGAPRGPSFFGLGTEAQGATVPLEAGRAYDLVVELQTRAFRQFAIGGLLLTARPPEQEGALARAVAAAAAADVAVVVVGADSPDTEGEDRADLELPADQADLVRSVCAVNPRTVVVVNAGAPLTLEWADDAAAVALLWYPGQEGGAALADVLFGDVDASGRLPTTLPRALEDTPAFASYPGRDGVAPYTESVFVGYRHYDHRDVTPRYPFGHGLSYTTFEYGDLDVGPAGDHVAVTVDVANTGGRAGTEVVQLYVRPLDPIVATPDKQLAAFAKVTLEAGAARSVTLAVPRRAFQHWDEASRSWVRTSDAYEVLVGSSSRAVHATARLAIAD